MPRKRSRRPPIVTLARRWSVVVAVIVVAYLYFNPLRTYMSTKHQLDVAHAQVTDLAAQHRTLRQQLADASSMNALARQARELGYVRPGEELFIVKGIGAWLRAHNTKTNGR